MNRDANLIWEAMNNRQQQFVTSHLHKVHTTLNQLSTIIHLNRSAETDQLLSKIRDVAEMLMQDAPAENAEGNAGKKRLKYDYEWVTAFLPRDIDISNRAGEEKVLDLAFKETLRLLVPDRKNPLLAARNMFGDEDFPGEIVSQYAHYQEHGFPDASEDGWYAVTDEDAENEPHGYPQGMTAIQNLLLNELKKRGFELTKISHADKERDKYPTVFMMRSKGPMHNVVEIDGMGSINGEHYKDYMANLKDGSEDAEHRSNAQNAAIAISLQKAGKKPS